MSKTLPKKEPAPQGAESPPRYPEKLYYKIGEICEISGLPAHVLRFWEREFPQLSPNKTRSGHRLYRKRDIETIFQIKALLYDQKFTIKGAREYLDRGPSAGTPHAAPSPGGEVLGRLRDGLNQILDHLNKLPPFDTE